MPLERFKHDLLNKSQDEIRLLRLVDDENFIACELVHMTIKALDVADIHYRALSYVWGPPSPNRDILVNGRLLSIRQNLYDFLETANRCKYFPGLIWIDQISIDQSTISERSHQVSLMSKIFGTAEEVIVWLGRADEMAMNTVSYLDRLLDGTSEPSVEDPEIAHLDDNSYFNRVWVIQEYVLARYRVVLWGDRLMTRSEWTRLCDLFQREIDNRDEGRMFEPWDNLMRLNWVQRAQGTRELGWQAVLSLNSPDIFCEDPRDYVYGLQGIVSEPCRNEIPTDYNEPADEVLIDAVGVLANATRATDHDWAQSLVMLVQIIVLLGSKMLPDVFDLQKPLSADAMKLFGCAFTDCPSRKTIFREWKEALDIRQAGHWAVRRTRLLLEALHDSNAGKQ